MPNTKLKVSLKDFILYEVDSHYQCGRVINILDIDTSDTTSESKIQIERYSNELEALDEEDIITEEQVVCNLYEQPPLGNLYGITFTLPPKKVKDGGNLIKLYFPREMRDENKTDTQPYLEALQKGFDLIEPIRSSFVEKEYEIFVEEGEFNKSSIKKSKKDFDNALHLKIKFAAPETIINALITAFSQVLWKTSTYESKSDWLKAFSEDLEYEKLTNSIFLEKFLLFLSEDKKDDLELEDEIVCKLIVKEVKRVKCLSLKELKILLTVNGEDYITKELLPEVVNSVRLKNSIRINPLTGINAVKKFGTELVSYLLTTKVDAQYERPLRMFFD